ncbi:hypothetical protein HJFPF1_04437 [Paramyrothecium foliicola]|nr:hypothetical protein HJFPF1_04437 [Paramyrothecium foliicola]
MRAPKTDASALSGMWKENRHASWSHFYSSPDTFTFWQKMRVFWEETRYASWSHSFGDLGKFAEDDSFEKAFASLSASDEELSVESPSKQAEAQYLHLPPRDLSRRTRIWHLIKLGMLTLAIGGLSAAIMQFYLFYGDLQVSPPDLSCSVQYAAGSERLFLIDLVFGKFTFAKAKTIDLAWDIVVGQGGRLLHGWILYRFIASDSLVWTLEHSAVPYDVLADLMFDTVSFLSIPSLTKLILRGHRVRVILTAIGLGLTILHTLSFAAVWTAATGYLSTSHSMYTMPDNSLRSLYTESLSLCWVLDARRLNMEQHELVVLGPDLKKTAEVLRLEGEIDPKPVHAYGDVGGDFRSQVPHSSDGSEDGAALVKESMGPDFWEVFKYAMVRRHIIRKMNNSGFNVDSYYTILSGDTINETFVVGDERWGLGFPVPLDIRRFDLNKTIEAGPGIVPYNSSLRYKDKVYHLDAPFLDIGLNCGVHNQYFTAMGSCVCYNDEPIRNNWFSRENVTCISDGNFSWGFSSLFTLIGLCLEMAWLLICLALWLDAQVNSKLLRWRRRGAGRVRQAMDLAQSLQRDLGPNTSTYSNAELEKEMSKCRPVHYSVKIGATDVPEISLVPERKQVRTKMVDGRGSFQSTERC